VPSPDRDNRARARAAGTAGATIADLAGVVLAAGAGTRLMPLTLLRPKPLCPVGDRPLLDHALAAVGPVVAELAVNVHHGRDQVEGHLTRWAERRERLVHISIERDRALGTAGAIGWLHRWLDGRPVLVANADTWHRADLGALVQDWDGERVRILTPTEGPFGPASVVVASLLPASMAEALAPAKGEDIQPVGLWEAVWRAEAEAGRLDTVHTDAVAIDCGTAADYLRANLTWSVLEGDGSHGGCRVVGGSVIGEGAVVEGAIERCVVWPGSRVDEGERLHDAIRAGHLTVLVR